MSYVIKQEKNKKKYYYLCDNISLSKGKRKQIREYIGKKKLKGKELNKKKEKFAKKVKSIKKNIEGYIYLTKDQINKIENINNNFWKKYKKLNKVEKKSFWEDFSNIFVYNTNSIEGSTLTAKEVELLLSKDISPNKNITDIIEARSAKKAINFILNYKKDLSINLITKLHEIYFKNSFPEIAGKFKRLNNKIKGSKYKTTPKNLVLTNLKIFIKKYKKNKKELHPIELAAWVHWFVVKIHPFQDGNGRISRLLMNLVLYKNRFALIDIKTKDKKRYFNSLEKCNKINNARPLAKRLARRFEKQYKNIFSEL